jgi:predicted anti-sigma-YlaC factor YlaD
MTHDEIRGALSAYFDGETGREQADEITAHLAACGECRAALERIVSLSVNVKKELGVKAPAGLARRVLSRSRAPEARRSLAPAAVTVALAVIVAAFVAGVAVKKYMPTMFASIQGMINGAASTLGASSGNK